MKITARKRTQHAKWRELGEGKASIKRAVPAVGLAQNGGVMLGKPWYAMRIPAHKEDFELQMTESEARNLFFDLGARLQGSQVIHVTTKKDKVIFR